MRTHIHTSTHPHPSGVPGKGAQIILSGLPAVQSTYMGQSGEGVCVSGGWRMERGSVATCLPMTADPVTTNAKVLYKHQADHHFPSSVTLSSTPPEDTASENKYMEEMFGMRNALFRAPN